VDRFYISPDTWNDEDLVLRGEEAHHCVRVMRKQLGDEIEVFNGRGHWSRGRIATVARDEVHLEVSESGLSAPLVPVLTLGQAIPKGKNMELIVQKAVELGVAVIVPLTTSHTIVRLDESEGERKREKWQRIALEACKQCGQNYLPQVVAPQALSEWLEGRDASELSLMASLAAGSRLFREVLRGVPEVPGSVTILIGPEGDFTPAEEGAAREAGFEPVSLGDIVLKVETATLHVVGGIRYEFAS
jgi:16S rRNA (uracil1498-N3)-methyltransferase